MINRRSAVALLCFGVACSPGDDGIFSGPEGVVVQRDGVTLTLRAGPRVLVESGSTTQLLPVASITELEHEIGHIGDVSVFDGGKVGVLDRAGHQVFIFRDDGTLVRVFGKEGEGPRELLHPLALTAVGDAIVVWSIGPNKVFSVFDATGEFRTSTPSLVEGDWKYIIWRFPISMEKNQQVPLSEDITQRISEFGPGHFIHSARVKGVGWTEDQGAVSEFVPTEVLIRYSNDFSTLDTIAALDGPPIQRTDLRTPDGTPFGQSIWAPRDHWVARNGLVAIFQNDQGRIEVSVPDGGTVLQVEW